MVHGHHYGSGAQTRSIIMMLPSENKGNCRMGSTTSGNKVDPRLGQAFGPSSQVFFLFGFKCEDILQVSLWLRWHFRVVIYPVCGLGMSLYLCAAVS